MMNENPITDWPKLQPWAVVGVSDNREKFGNIIFRDLLQAGYTVYAINPKLTEVEGQPCYPNLKACPDKPSVVDLVVSPHVALAVIEECAQLGIKRIWFQPGSESDEAIEKAKSLGISVLANACILIEKVPVV